MTTNDSTEYLIGLVRELCKLPQGVILDGFWIQ